MLKDQNSLDFTNIMVSDWGETMKYIHVGEEIFNPDTGLYFRPTRTEEIIAIVGKLEKKDQELLANLELKATRKCHLDNTSIQSQIAKGDSIVIRGEAFEVVYWYTRYGVTICFLEARK